MQRTRARQTSFLDDTCEKLATILVDAWSNGRPVCLYVSIVSPVIASQVVRASSEMGHAFKSGESLKIEKYFLKCLSQHMAFIPVVLESFGGFGTSAISVLKRLSDAYSDSSGLTRPQARERVFQRISFTFQRFLSDSFVSRSARFGS